MNDYIALQITILPLGIPILFFLGFQSTGLAVQIRAAVANIGSYIFATCRFYYKV